MSTALITGATVNTGLGIALKFAREGWDVVITSRREDALPLTPLPRLPRRD